MHWQGFIRLAFEQLGLKPSDFWQLTPAELFLFLGVDTSPVPFSRTHLDELVRRFPDKKSKDAIDGNRL